MSFLQRTLDLIIPAAQAHEKWFVTEASEYIQPEFFHTLNPATLTGAVAAMLALALGIAADRWFESSALYAKFEARIRPYRDYAAGILAATTGVTLIIMSMRGHLFADNIGLPAGTLGDGLRIAQGMVGLLLVIGLYTPYAALGLLALYVSSFAVTPYADIIDYLHFPAIAAFLFVFARGRYSLDWFLGKPVYSTPAQRKTAYFVLRTLVGISITMLALIKYQDPGLHLALMDRYPTWNPYVIANWLGIHMSREVYVFILFCIEAVVGLFITFGLITRIMAVVLVPIFTGSIIFLGVGELVGHLPLLGLLVVFFVYGDTYHKGREADRYAHKAEQKTPAPTA